VYKLFLLLYYYNALPLSQISNLWDIGTIYEKTESSYCLFFRMVHVYEPYSTSDKDKWTVESELC